MTTADSILLVGLVGLALGLTAISIRIRILPYSMAAMIAWITLDIAFITGEIGPGFGVLWVEAISILFILLAFAPLIVQGVEDVSHETEYEGTTMKWTSFRRRGWIPGEEDPYNQRRSEVRRLANKRKRPRRRTWTQW